jgi:hypothetical protein
LGDDQLQRIVSLLAWAIGLAVVYYALVVQGIATAMYLVPTPAWVMEAARQGSSTLLAWLSLKHLAGVTISALVLAAIALRVLRTDALALCGLVGLAVASYAFASSANISTYPWLIYLDALKIGVMPIVLCWFLAKIGLAPPDPKRKPPLSTHRTESDR